MKKEKKKKNCFVQREIHVEMHRDKIVNLIPLEKYR